MSTNFKTSETAKNLMRAFAGESQARNRYTFAAECAKKHQLPVIEAVFNFTAGQEMQHAYIFYNHLKEMTGEKIEISGDYPIETFDNVLSHLNAAVKNEFAEHDPIYKDFANVAKSEGFAPIAASFEMIAEIEKTHGNRFKKFADFLQNNKLFVADDEESWLCLNCGHIHNGTSAPGQCPVCSHEQGYFIRLSLAPYTCNN